MKRVMHKKLVFLFIGRTASGKSSLARYMCEALELKQVKSLTTRPPRDGEITGSEDHYFISKDIFNKINQKCTFAAYTEINGYKYATTVEELRHSDIYVIDPNGVKYLKEHLQIYFLYLFLNEHKY